MTMPGRINSKGRKGLGETNNKILERVEDILGTKERGIGGE